MKKRILVSLATMGIVATLVGGATFAIFTDQSTNASNTFTAGTLEVEAGAQNTQGVVLTNMAPGDTIDGTFVVTNTGTLELRFDTTANISGTIFEGTTPAVVTIDNAADVVVAPNGGTQTVSYHVNLPQGAGNTYMGATGDLTFTVDAEQTANNPLPAVQ
ncbi:MAG: hypothetical protein H6Q63_186 [Firmicutes bacterium]|nr:hypothetical protein [Bacillota bacterium]